MQALQCHRDAGREGKKRKKGREPQPAQNTKGGPLSSSLGDALKAALKDKEE